MSSPGPSGANGDDPTGLMQTACMGVHPAQQRADRRWAAHLFWHNVAEAILIEAIPLDLAVRLDSAEARANWELLGLANGPGLPEALEAIIYVTMMLPRRAIPLLVEITGAPAHPQDLEKEVYYATSAEPNEPRPTWLRGISDIDVRERLLIRRMKSFGPPTAAEVLEAAAMSVEDVEHIVATWPR